MQTRRTARAVALLLVLNLKEYENERERQVTRFRVNIQTLRRLAGRKYIRDAFLFDIRDELAELNWLFYRREPDFVVVDLSKSDSWVRLGSRRLETNGRTALSDEALEAFMEENYPDVMSVLQEPDE